MSLFKRMFGIAEAKGHALVDKMEDPKEMIDQGLRDLRKDLNESIKALAEAKSVVINLKRDLTQKREAAASYKVKATVALKKIANGDLSEAEGNRLATVALGQQKSYVAQVERQQTSVNKAQTNVDQIESNIGKLKAQISEWEGEAAVLESRSKVAGATKKLNQQMAQIDSSGTVAMLNRMRAKVDKEESLAESYGEISDANKSIDDELAVLDSTTPVSDDVEKLKKELGL